MDPLAEAWEFQKRFGNIDRPTSQTNPEDQDQPPPFHRFVPGRKGRPPPLMVESEQLQMASCRLAASLLKTTHTACCALANH